MTWIKKQAEEAIDYGKEVVSGHGGTASASRWVLIGSIIFMSLIWAGVMVGIGFFEWEWDKFSGALDWAKNFLFISVIPYITNKVSGVFNGKVKEQ